jgi:glycosyltransferase involved in cell wall biosynthesis
MCKLDARTSRRRPGNIWLRPDSGHTPTTLLQMLEVPQPHEPDERSVGQRPEHERVPVTVVIPARDEAFQIAEAISALTWAAEVIVVDGDSTDSTARLARKAGAKVIDAGSVTIGAKRNAGIEAASHDWILALDADERVSDALRARIEHIVRAPSRRAYRIRFRNFFLDRELTHGAYGRDSHVRLFTNDRRYTEAHVHEHLTAVEDVGVVEETILHRPFRDFPHYIRKVVQYARWGADDIRIRGKTVGYADVLVRPAWRFVRDYLIRGGCLDGFPGFLVCAYAGVGTFLKYCYAFVDQRYE